MGKTMKTSALKAAAVIVGVAVAIILLSSCTKKEEKFLAPVFKNIGTYRMKVTTSSKNARMFFDQGIIFTYGFNHGEAARSFREAIRLDSSFAMAYWGLAYTLGPNYNAPLDPSNRDEILWAIEKASSYKKNVSEWEKGLIEASEVKYVPETEAPQLNAFAEAMKMLFRHYPDNADIATLYAEALMLQHPWDLYDYKGGPEKEWTPEIVRALEEAIRMSPEHPLANHLNIHATEAASKPEAGMKSAERLSKLIIPGAGHLVHMPSHTYINTGDYHLGTEVNLDAVKADSIYSAQCVVQGAFPLYYYHNYHFLAACAALEGRGALAIESSFQMMNTIDTSLLRKPGFETTQHFLTIPYNVLVKFAQWEKILVLNDAYPGYPYVAAIRHYARGMAYANVEQLPDARNELKRLIEIQNENDFSEMYIFGINSMQEVIEIAMRVLEAEIAQKNNNFKRAEQLLIDAITIEDGMNYQEPPDWFFSVRHLLGDLYMQIGRFSEAEQVYQKDLANFPKNGFALNGLYESYMAQEKFEEAKSIKEGKELAWSFADTPLKYSRVDESLRQNLALKISSNSPGEIYRIASAFCGLSYK